MLRFEYVIEDGFGKIKLMAPGGHVTECLMVQYEPQIYDTLCEFLPDRAKAAEIGSFKGGSACILWDGMTRRSKRLELYSHDLFEPFTVGQRVEDIESAFDASVRAWGASVTKVKGDSKETHAAHADGSLDYVFIDGDHTYDGALADIQNFVPKIATSGWLVIQDCIGDVDRAVKDGVPEVFHRACIVPPYGHYVTVCHRDRSKLDEFLSCLDEVFRASK